MPRANRQYLQGQVWHITHRASCKWVRWKKEEGRWKKKRRVFARDRGQWVGWLREARRRFGLSVLNYMVTSNHIHLLVADDGQPETIFKTMQLIAGRTGQEYNQSRGFVDQVALCPGEAYNFKYK